MPDAGSPLPRLMLVTDRHRGTIEQVAAAVLGGIRLVQVREKDLDDAGFLQYWRQLQTALPPAVQPRWLFNNRLELALAHGCGLHLPASAASLPAGLRQELACFGRSVHDPAELERALAEAVDYVIVGTLFPTRSKPGRETLGLEGLAPLLQQAGNTPVFAIGGVNARQLPALRAAGAHGAALSGALLTASRPDQAASALLALC